MRVVGFDPSLTSLGIATMIVDLKAGSMKVESLRLVKTEKTTAKTVRAGSDRLDRARLLARAMNDAVKDCVLCFSELPAQPQSAAAAISFGIVTGLLASLKIPMIQVQQNETKLASVGRKTATKPEMIAWASSLYPQAEWLRLRNRLINDNEHLADAIAVVHAGLRTNEFQAINAMLTQS